MTFSHRRSQRASRLSERIREIRINPIIPVESVLIVTERGNRPEKKAEPLILDRRSRVEGCQFCRGDEHQTHSQIIAMPVIPANVEMEIFSSRKYFQEQGNCIFCTLMDERLTYEGIIYDKDSGELKKRIEVEQYIVDRGDRFIAIKPFASRFPWEVHILPKQHSHDYRSISDTDCLDLATVLRRVMLRLQAILGVVQYNYFLHSAPAHFTTAGCEASFHWHLEICPRTTVPNGFELGSGLAINTVSPEKAAEQLRAIQL